MAASVPDKNIKKKTEKKLAAREEAKLLASFMAVMNNMRKQVSGGGREMGDEVGELWASRKEPLEEPVALRGPAKTRRWGENYGSEPLLETEGPKLWQFQVSSAPPF